MPPSKIEDKSRKEREELLAALKEKDRRQKRRYFFGLFPATGEFRRELYPRHVEFFTAGAEYTERCFMAANRIGKTVSGAFEMTGHLTGEYPDWWPGWRRDRAGRYWAAGKTNETTRDIVQKELLGNIIYDGQRKIVDGTGMIPGDLLDMGAIAWKQGVSNLIDTIGVKHVDGGTSVLGLKSYQQGRGSFEGTAQDGIWLDEEPPVDIYGECLIRTATTRGRVFITFTPLEGMSEVVLGFMPQEYQPGE